MLGFDDRELKALITAATALPIESRERFLNELVLAVGTVGAADVPGLIDLLFKSHAAASAVCLEGDCNERHQGLDQAAGGVV
jgi:hypothetical protein